MLSLLSAIVPLLHIGGLNSAILKTRLPWPPHFHPIELLGLQLLGYTGAWLSLSLFILWACSLRFKQLTGTPIMRPVLAVTLAFWILYAVTCALSLEAALEIY